MRTRLPRALQIIASLAVAVFAAYGAGKMALAFDLSLETAAAASAVLFAVAVLLVDHPQRST